MIYSPGFIRRMDQKVRAIVHARGFCVRCGRTDTLTAAHVERRRFYGTRWDPEAVLCLCVRCHAWFDTKRREAERWLRGQIGGEAFDAIHARRSGMPEPSQVESDLARWVASTGSPLPGDPGRAALGPRGQRQPAPLGPQPIVGAGWKPTAEDSGTASSFGLH